MRPRVRFRFFFTLFGYLFDNILQHYIHIITFILCIVIALMRNIDKPVYD